MFYLKSHFGLPTSFHSIRHVALASKLRVSFFEIKHVTQKYNELQGYINSTSFMDRPARLRDWLNSSYVGTLHNANCFLCTLGVTPRALWRRLTEEYVHPMTLAQWLNARSNFQKAAVDLLLRLPALNTNMEHRVRQKMARWNLPCPPGIVSRRILKRLPEVAKLVAPWVQTAVLKTLWNGWVVFKSKQPAF